MVGFVQNRRGAGLRRCVCQLLLCSGESSLLASLTLKLTLTVQDVRYKSSAACVIRCEVPMSCVAQCLRFLCAKAA